MHVYILTAVGSNRSLSAESLNIIIRKLNADYARTITVEILSNNILAQNLKIKLKMKMQCKNIN